MHALELETSEKINDGNKYGTAISTCHIICEFFTAKSYMQNLLTTNTYDMQCLVDMNKNVVARKILVQNICK